MGIYYIKCPRCGSEDIEEEPGSYPWTRWFCVPCNKKRRLEEKLKVEEKLKQLKSKKMENNIQREFSIATSIMTIAQGNAGAIECLMGIFGGNEDNVMNGLVIIPKIEELKIVGTDLYVFWSDLCGKDYNKMRHLCQNCPNEILKDACGRQDYSGRGLVKPYLETFKP